MQRTPYRGDSATNDSVAPDVGAAFRRWARSVLGAPRKLDQQITAVEERDEIITRVATTVVRRDLVQERMAAHRRARKAAEPVHPGSIDPFAESLEALRRRTEYTERCAGCAGGGVVACSACAGSGRQACGNCGGSGQVLRQYKKSSKYIRCTVCRAGGSVGCGGCSATGSITCQGCTGSGEQLVWWAFRERTRVVVELAPESAILAAHPYLCEERFLAPGALEAFTLFLTVEAQGPVAAEALSPEDASLRDQLTPALNQQLERIVSQQFLCFGALRCDIRYEMCGAQGTVVLSGANLVGAATPAAVAPIRRRVLAWGVVGLLLVVLAMWYGGALSGPTAYFAGVNQAITLILIVGFAGALVAVGGALRALRPGWRFWPIGLVDRVAAGTLALAILLCPLVAYFGRPQPEEARAAITSGDVERAKLVIDALAASRPETQVKDLVDELQLAKAEGLPAGARLAELDAVAARGGSHAAEARQHAREARLRAIGAELAADRPADALGLLERWTPNLAGGDDVDELRAQAFDKQAAVCREDACRYGAARSARSAHATPERRAAVEKTRDVLLAALAVGAPPKEDLLAQARALRELSASAASTQAIAGDDAELADKARTARSWASAARAKIGLLGAPIALVDELLERSGTASATVGWADLEGAAVHASVDRGQCKGLYVVGATAGSRALSGKEAGLKRLLIQATGRPDASLHGRPSSARTHEVSKWTEGTIAVLARWNGSTLMELRIGDATP